MGEVCLCDMSGGSKETGLYGATLSVKQSPNTYDNYQYPHASQLSDHIGKQNELLGKHKNKDVNPDANDCCDDVAQCNGQCMCNPPLINSQKNSFVKTNTSSYPQQRFAHFYHIYIILSSPPPVV